MAVIESKSTNSFEGRCLSTFARSLPVAGRLFSRFTDDKCAPMHSSSALRDLAGYVVDLPTVPIAQLCDQDFRFELRDAI